MIEFRKKKRNPEKHCVVIRDSKIKIKFTSSTQIPGEHRVMCPLS